MDELLTILDSNSAGYKSVWSFESWRIAMMTDAPYLRRCNFKTISRHFLTDEVFVLTDGNANMYIAEDDGGRPVNVKRIALEKNKAYVVRAGTWHQAETFEGTRILIVENDNTDDENSETVEFDFD